MVIKIYLHPPFMIMIFISDRFETCPTILEWIDYFGKEYYDTMSVSSHSR